MQNLMARGKCPIKDLTPHVIRGARPKLPMSSLLLLNASLVFSLLSVGSFAGGQPLEPKMKSQPPWAYTYRIDADKIDFLATTPALEDRDVWLLLACRDNQTFYASLVDADTFAFPLSERPELALRLDELPAISLPSAVIEQKQITARPSSATQFFSLLTRSNLLSVSVPEQGSGAIHRYSFSLQPNDLALREIDVHWFQSGV